MMTNKKDLTFIDKFMLKLVLDMNRHHYLPLTLSQARNINFELHYDIFNIFDPKVTHMTSGLKCSVFYARYLAYKSYKHLRASFVSFDRYCSINHQPTYTYLLTINPKADSTYRKIYHRNHQTVEYLKSLSKVALMQSAIESSISFSRFMDRHLHVLIHTTSRINQRSVARGLSHLLYLHGKEIDIRQGKTKTDEDKLIHYVTKQQGLFMPLKFNQDYQMTQFQMLCTLLHKDKTKVMKLLSSDIKGSKSLPYRHHFYVNTDNRLARSWKFITKTPLHHSLSLFKVKATPKVTTSNGRTFTHHHTSNNEALSRFYHKGYYSIEDGRDVAQTKSISLFGTVDTRRPRTNAGLGTTSQNLIEPKVNLSNSNKNSNSKFENENPRSRTLKDSS